MAASDFIDPLSGGVGGVGGGLLAAFIAKLYIGKSEKEIEAIKDRLDQNEKADTIRDIAIAVLQENNKNIEKSLISIDNRLEKLLEKFEKQ